MPLPAGFPAGGSHGVVSRVAVDQLVERLAPAVVGDRRMIVAEQRHAAARLDDRVEAAECIFAVHPMKGPADDRQAELAEGRPDVARRSFTELNRRAGPRGGLPGDAKHFRLGIDGDDMPDQRGESQGELAGAAAEVEDAVRGREFTEVAPLSG